jgi:hypothetical protein
MEATLLAICFFHLKFIVIFGFLSYFLNIAAHIKNKTFNYRNALKPLQNLAGYIFIILIFSSLIFVNSVIVTDNIPSIVTKVFNFNTVLYLSTILILTGYVRKILESMMIFGYDVAKFLPFLSEGQKVIRKRYNIDDGAKIVSNGDKKANIW